ncbi:hypothetical protein Tco_1452419, partial [Tanacetum coccineum]
SEMVVVVDVMWRLSRGSGGDGTAVVVALMVVTSCDGGEVVAVVGGDDDGVRGGQPEFGRNLAEDGVRRQKKGEKMEELARVLIKMK